MSCDCWFVNLVIFYVSNVFLSSGLYVSFSFSYINFVTTITVYLILCWLIIVIILIYITVTNFQPNNMCLHFKHYLLVFYGTIKGGVPIFNWFSTAVVSCWMCCRFYTFYWLDHKFLRYDVTRWDCISNEIPPCEVVMWSSQQRVYKQQQRIYRRQQQSRNVWKWGHTALETCPVKMQVNKYGRGTERHLPKTDESVVWPAGERR